MKFCEKLTEEERNIALAKEIAQLHQDLGEAKMRDEGKVEMSGESDSNEDWDPEMKSIAISKHTAWSVQAIRDSHGRDN